MFRLSKQACGLVGGMGEGGRGGGGRESGVLNTDGASKSNQQLSMGSGLRVLTSVPLALPSVTGEIFRGGSLYTQLLPPLPLRSESCSCQAVCISSLYVSAFPQSSQGFFFISCCPNLKHHYGRYVSLLQMKHTPFQAFPE